MNKKVTADWEFVSSSSAFSTAWLMPFSNTVFDTVGKNGELKNVNLRIIEGKLREEEELTGKMSR